MHVNVSLSDSESALVNEILHREQKQLMVEIRHTDSANYREILRKRLTLVESAMKQFDSAVLTEHA